MSSLRKEELSNLRLFIQVSITIYKNEEDEFYKRLLSR